jgi:ribosomal 50S subunit-recycling heat shock protein
MRIDLLLKSLCLVKTRSQAQRGCEAGFVTQNGRRAKPSSMVRAGDVIEIRYPRKVLAIEMLEVPSGQVARRECERFYRVIREKAIEERGEWYD